MSTRSAFPARRPAAFAAVLAVLAVLATLPFALATAAEAPPAEPKAASPVLDVRPAPPLAPAAAALAAWHRRYLPHARPVKAAMGTLLAARQEVDPTRYKRRYRQACEILGRAVSPFTDADRRHELYPQADAAARYHLLHAYAALADAAAAGEEGRFQTAEIALADAARWFRQAARVLERYGLEP
jgi:hypothetical protein